MKKSNLFVKNVKKFYNVKLFTNCFIFLFLFSYQSWSAILISNISELQSIGNSPSYPLNGDYELTQDIDASETITWNGGAGFSPIGTASTPFTGKMDGKGFLIYNLYINRPTLDNVGLFSTVSSTGVISNLGLVDSNITGRNNTGILVGRNSGLIEKCYTDGGSVMGVNNVGPIVGYDTGTIRRCYATSSALGTSYVGGLVGRTESVVEQCYSTGNVTGNNSVGGLAGGKIGKKSAVNRSYSLCSVLGYSSNVGGLIGSCINGKVRYSYSAGSVAGSANTGGLIGYRSGGLIQFSYWDTQTSGWTTSAGGTGRTTAQMKQQSTYKS